MISNVLEVEKDIYSNYPPEDFEELEFSLKEKQYSYYCYTLCKWADGFYLLRVSDIETIDNRYFVFVCPAYKLGENMAKKRIVVEPNRLNLTPGKLSIDLNDLPPLVLDHTNSVYDSKLKKRVPITLDIEKENNKKEKKEKVPTVKKEKIEDEMVNNTDSFIDGKLHSSHFLPPVICTRIWVLSLGTNVGWGWFLRPVDGFKNKFEYYCRPIELELGQEQYERGGDFFTFAYLKSEFKQFDRIEFTQDTYIKLSKQFETKAIDSIQVSIDAMLLKQNYYYESY